MNQIQVLSQNLAQKLDLGIDGQGLVETLKATAFKGQVTDAQMSALLIVAQQYGLNPWTKEIYAYPDKNNGIVPVVGVDGWSRIINSHPQFNGMTFEYSTEMTQHKGKVAHEWIECKIYRKDREHPIVVREYFDEVCRTANFITPWDSHPKRMHRHKTLIQSARIGFGFAGIYDEDEAQRIVHGEKDITPKADNVISITATISSEQAEQLRNAINFAGLSEEAFCSHKRIKIACVEELPSARFEGAMRYLQSLVVAEDASN